MLDDSILILLLILAALTINIIVWFVKDIKRINQETEETEHWLEHGEEHDNNYS